LSTKPTWINDMFASSYLSSSNVSVSHGSHGSPHNSAEQAECCSA
jgi:hypothetical protein